MAKSGEISFYRKFGEERNLTPEALYNYFINKPYSDGNYWSSLLILDLAQMLKIMPDSKPNGETRLLDIGCGSGWSSEFFARRGYNVLGLDICPDFIDTAKDRIWRCKASGLDLYMDFVVNDYEEAIPPYGKFDVITAYDTLHHITDERRAIRNLFECLNSGGVMITMEPGINHGKTQNAKEAKRVYNTTERDMAPITQIEAMREAGFGTVETYYRYGHFPMLNLSDSDNVTKQWETFINIAHGVSNGYTALVLGKKDGVQSDYYTFDLQREIASRVLCSLYDSGKLEHGIADNLIQIAHAFKHSRWIKLGRKLGFLKSINVDKL